MYCGALYLAEYCPETVAVVTPPAPAVDASTTRGQGFASRRTLPYRGPSVVTRYEDGVAVETINPFEEIGAPQRERPTPPQRPAAPQSPPAVPSQTVPVGKEVIGRREAAPIVPELPAPVEPDLGRRVRERKRREIQAFNAAVIARIVGEMSDL